MKKRTSKPKNSKLVLTIPIRSTDVFVTQPMLYAVRDELKSEFSSVRSEISSIREEVSSVRSEISSVRSEISSVREEVASVKADGSSLRAEMALVRSDLSAQISAMGSSLMGHIHHLGAEIHGIKLLVEEQNARNRIVMDGLTELFFRQERVEAKTDEFEKTLVGFK